MKKISQTGLEPLAEYAKRFKRLEYVPFAARADKAQLPKSNDLK